ncbi:putative oligopeptidase [Listeria cornellensis FSL F6-0969]|uniref:Putative oligopeptidase n=1 Tax=Listeria cornellensis FSL F6-0969 TaxID=1265820 RepID=W7C9S2_9LIST|nr:putative oligopeptidase [Listeria cornellensis FSL F6-0969]
MMAKNYALIWDLDSIYSGGSGSEALANALSDTTKDIASFKQAVQDWPIPENNEAVSEFLLLINRNAEITKQLMNAAAFLECLSSADTRDLKAVELTGGVYQQLAELETIENEWHEKFALIPDVLWASLLAENGLSEIAFVLNEARENRKEKRNTGRRGRD